MASHQQDWEVVVLNRRRATNEMQRPRHVPVATVTPSLKPAWKIEKQVDSDTGKPINRVGTQTGKELMQKRVAAKLTQAQLAVLVNMQEKYIKEIEAGTAIENKAHISKLRRALEQHHL